MPACSFCGGEYGDHTDRCPNFVFVYPDDSVLIPIETSSGYLRELYSRKNGYAPGTISLTEGGKIAIDVGGHIVTMGLDQWHKAGRIVAALQEAERLLSDMK